jgi:hypothetical protein
VAETERLLGEKTAHWTEAQRESWRTFLADKFTPSQSMKKAFTVVEVLIVATIIV